LQAKISGKPGAWDKKESKGEAVELVPGSTKTSVMNNIEQTSMTGGEKKDK